MRKEILATGRTVEEAIDNGCAELGITRGLDDYDHEIVDMPSKGFLGLGTKPAKVRLWIELPDEKPVVTVKAGWLLPYTPLSRNSITLQKCRSRF